MEQQIDINVAMNQNGCCGRITTWGQVCAINNQINDILMGCDEKPNHLIVELSRKLYEEYLTGGNDRFTKYGIPVYVQVKWNDKRSDVMRWELVY